MDQQKVLEFLEWKWIKIYQTYDMLDDSIEGYQEVKELLEEQLEALETVIEMLK